MKAQKPVLLALLGTLIEYYDYALYGFAAPFLAHAFFPTGDPSVALLKAYGIFIAGSCAKPVGSLLFGYLGDHYGRAYALKISITGIAIPTFLIGILPDYHTIGYLAPWSLLVCRILQGIFVAGESDNARVFIFEILHKKNSCFANSLAYGVCMLGISIASFYAASMVATPHVIEIGGIIVSSWRLPFLVGGGLGIVLFWLRQNLKETEIFLRVQKELMPRTFPKEKKPYFFAVLIALILTGAAGGQYHFYFVFLNQYLSSILNFWDPTTAAYLTAKLLLIFSFAIPISGWVMDKLSVHYTILSVLRCGSGVIIFLVIIHIFYISVEQLPIELLYLTAAALAFIQASTFVVILHQFDVSFRCRGASLGHAMGSMLFSGTTPFISLWLGKTTGVPIAPFYYFLFLCGMSYLGFRVLANKQKAVKPALPSTVLAE